ncbi:MAG: hypothetical protein ACHQ0Y_13280 [Thermodesulfovibrionales bacterium]
MPTRIRLITTIAVLLLAAANAAAIVYSVDSLIDVDRMAVDKMYYDFYYNPVSELFFRSDLLSISPTAQALMNKAIASKVDRADTAINAGSVDYAQATGINTCAGDPFIGSGTPVNPDIKTLTQPQCLQGGAYYADQNMGYVYMVASAMKATNATEVTDAYRVNSFNNQVPRVLWSPYADVVQVSENFVVHDDGNIIWSGGVPAGLPPGLINCVNGAGASCITVVKDGAEMSSVFAANWADYAWEVGGLLSDIDLNRLTVQQANSTVNLAGQENNIGNRTYYFTVNNYTVSKTVLFCPDQNGWGGGTRSFDGIPDQGPSFGGPFCGDNYICYRGACTTYDTSNPPACIGYHYDCVTINNTACFDHTTYECRNQTGTITVTDIPQTISFSLGGADASYEPQNLDPTLVNRLLTDKLPQTILVGGYSLADDVRCNGTPENIGQCFNY